MDRWVELSDKISQEVKEVRKETTQELAQERTLLARQRTRLAIQRTFSAWLRTGLSTVLAGLAIVKLLADDGNWPSYVKVIGGIFIVTGSLTYIIALWRYYTSHKQLKDGGVKPTPFWTVILLALALLVSSTLVFILLFG